MESTHFEEQIISQTESCSSISSPSLLLDSKRNEFQRVVGIRPDTPDSVLTEQSFLPDLSLLCDICETLIPLQDLKRHKKFHRCLKELQFSESDEPLPNELIDQRKKLVQGKLMSFEQISNIDAAFEFLMTFLYPPFEEPVITSRKTESLFAEENFFSVGLTTSSSFIDGVGSAVYKIPDCPLNNEDTCSYQDSFGSHPEKCYFGLFSGFEGNFAARLAARELHHGLVNEIRRFDPSISCTCAYNLLDPLLPHSTLRNEVHRARTVQSERVQLQQFSASMVEEIVHTCARNLDARAAAEANLSASNVFAGDTYALKMNLAYEIAYQYTDSLLKCGQDSYSTTRWSGCSAATAVFCGRSAMEFRKDADQVHAPIIGNLYVANAGNVSAVLVRCNQSYKLTENHTPCNSKELRRLKAAGGHVSKSKKELLVNGVLPSTRGLGYHGDMKLKKCVLATPRCHAVDIDSKCQAVIFASASVWKVLSLDEVRQIVTMALPCNYEAIPSSLSVNSLLDESGIGFTKTKATRVDAKTGVVDGDRRFSTTSLIHGLERSDAAQTIPSMMESRASSYSKQSSNKDVPDQFSHDWTDEDTQWSGAGFKTPMTSFSAEIAEQAARCLTQAAIMAGSKENVAALVVLFPAAFHDDWLKLPEF